MSAVTTSNWNPRQTASATTNAATFHHHFGRVASLSIRFRIMSTSFVTPVASGPNATAAAVSRANTSCMACLPSLAVRITRDARIRERLEDGVRLIRVELDGDATDRGDILRPLHLRGD